jgi:hypothetical protein
LNMVNMMDLPHARHHLDAMLFDAEDHKHRVNSVRWIINDVAHNYKLSTDARDQAIQILDAFLTSTKKLGTTMDSRFVAYAAVTAITFSFKLNESARSLRLSSFKDFNLTELKEMELLILHQLAFNLTPQITPAGFVHELLSIWDPTEGSNCKNDASATIKTNLAKIADGLIAEFWLEQSSMLYAPSTIAISAIILAFSILHCDCSDWLASVPNFCLPLPATNLSSSTPPQDANVRRLLDVDACLVSFSRVPSLLCECTDKAGHDATTSALRNPISPTSKVALLSPVALHPPLPPCDSRDLLIFSPIPPDAAEDVVIAEGVEDVIRRLEVDMTVFKIKSKRDLQADVRPPSSTCTFVGVKGEDEDEDMPAPVRRRI